MTVAIAVLGTGASAWLARCARRSSVRDRLRVAESARIPAWLRVRLVRALDAAAIDTPPEQVVQMWLLSGLVGGLIGLALDPRLAAAGVVAVLIAGPLALRLIRERRARAVTLAVPDALERVAAELRAGGTVAGALARMQQDGGALAGDIARIRSRVELGASLPEALSAWSRERTAAGTSTTAGTLAVAHEAGGQSAAALDSLAASLRARLAVVAEAHALSAQARYSAIVVGLGPLGYLGFSVLVDPGAADALLGTTVGRACAVVGITLELTGAWWMRRILRQGAAA